MWDGGNWGFTRALYIREGGTHRDKLWPTTSPRSRSSRNAETNCSLEIEPFRRSRFSEVMSPAVWVLGRRAVDVRPEGHRSELQAANFPQSAIGYLPVTCRLSSCCVQLLVDHLCWQLLRQPLFLRFLTRMSVSSGPTKLHIGPAIPKYGAQNQELPWICLLGLRCYFA